ncbi:2-dehydropantoate 2-reductase [Dyella sp. OK004]|uniref:2-dehydropantoate 2-reductase n=1 Tax=Dyella sp. OK004 TaxID=1855292 RepID=UPI0008F2C781|nr:2-dehydropantoate 2-reductase [Dyella sp. OK004]SFR92101.1 2-dehydropantoate 2-reductase [Dyella sp. OK004]
MNDQPAIVIYGAGSVGCYLGGRLHEHIAVRLITRPRMADVLHEHGLTLSDLQGFQQHIPAKALDVQIQAQNANAPLTLVTVKSADTAQAGRELADVLPPDAIVISFQNGLHNADLLRTALPGRTVLAGMVPFNVLQHAPGRFHQGSGGELMVEAHPALAPYLPAFTAAGLPLQQHTDMPAIQRAKLLFNLNNAINALSNRPLRQELAERGWRRCLALAQREALAIFAAAHLPVARLTPLPPHWLPNILTLPNALFARIAPRMLAIDPLARSSTWEDLQAGRRTEVDVLHGAIVELAAMMGKRAPVNQRIIELIREAEKAPVEWTSERLLRELREAQSKAG